LCSTIKTSLSREEKPLARILRQMGCFPQTNRKVWPYFLLSVAFLFAAIKFYHPTDAYKFRPVRVAYLCGAQRPACRMRNMLNTSGGPPFHILIHGHILVHVLFLALKACCCPLSTEIKFNQFPKEKHLGRGIGVASNSIWVRHLPTPTPYLPSVLHLPIELRTERESRQSGEWGMGNGVWGM